MRLVRIEGVREGMQLARDIPAASLGSAPLLRHGVRLTPGLAARLGPRGVRAVWVEDDLGEGVVPFTPLSDEIRHSTEQAVIRCLDGARGTEGRMSADAIAQLESAALGVLHALEDCPEAALAFDDLATADSYTYGHSIRVATLGLVLAERIARLDGWVDWEGNRRFDDAVARMTEMAMGLLIHDIGKLAIPEAVLNKPEALSDEEWQLVQTHPSAGASLLPADRVSALTICVVRDHHERWDGAGYEQGRTGEQTHQFARIAAVADVYDAITSDRPYRAATPPHVAVRAIREGAGTQFDPDVVRHFLRVAMPYPVGYTIELPSGVSGVVTRVDPDTPEHPVVRFRDPSGHLEEAAIHIVDGVVQEPVAAGLYN
jgi:HD-GYP domain-containing protein (c-di-GMP phosphodiesterase class II)